MKKLDAEHCGSLTDDRVRSAVEYLCERFAHDFNNILTPLQAYPDMIAPLLSDERGMKYVQAMQDAVDHALNMTQRLAWIAGADQGKVSRFDLAKVASGAVDEINKQLAEVEDLELEQALAGPCEVVMQQDAFVLALEALLENAIRAVCNDGGGRVTIGGERVRIDCTAGFGGEIIPQGEYQLVWVADDGPGMDASELRVVVEPFRTGSCKSAGCGAGLGLSMAYCCLRRNGAFLRIESTPRLGTKAIIYLPLFKDGDTGVKKEHASVSDSKQDNVTTDAPRENVDAPGAQGERRDEVDMAMKRVLVVDDERSIVNLFKMILENFIQGILVDKAENGAQALELFKRERHDVLVMDLHMPVLDGQAAFYEIQRFCESERVSMPSVVFCTGYAPRAPLRQTIAEDKRHLLLNKPVQSEVLVGAVRERLGMPA